MDNWGDPWADNAKSPTKDAVTSPLPPTFAPAPALLNGFLDDAGWGNEDERLGDWSTAPTQEEEYAPPTKSSTTEPSATELVEQPSNEHQWDTATGPEQHATRDEGDWAAVTLDDAPQDEEQVLSETSDSTTVQANDTTGTASTDASAHLNPDDDSSARTSTSPSEASHNDLPAESPRTSYEEERGTVKPVQAEETEQQGRASVHDSLVEGVESAGNENIGNEGGDDVRTGEDGDKTERVHNTPEVPATALESCESTNEAPSDSSTTGKTRLSVNAGAFTVDPELLEKLFDPQTDQKQLDPAEDDPVSSTSARKAWYRLTRKQTLREFNHGMDDDNYVRVTWTNSNIRTEVKNIVGRWAREDRLSGTGPGARASFYWDSPAPVEPPTGMHARQRSSIPASAIVWTKESLPPLPTNVPASFNWSSASATTDPWQQPSPGLRSTSSPIAPPMAPAVTNARRQEVRAASLDLTSHKPGPSRHARNLTVAHETPAVANLISPPITNANAPSFDPWAGLVILDVQPTTTDNPSTAHVDDEDEWGEMVSSPTVSTPTLTEPISQADTRNNTISTTPTTPQSIRSVAVRDQSPDMSATTIVRLKSTISPTSAYFKAKNFVPLGVEQGPIGPGILKSAKHSISVTRKNAVEQQPPKVDPEPVPSVAQEESVSKLDASDEFSEWQISIPDEKVEPASTRPPDPVVQEVVRPRTPPQPAAAPLESNVDAWADADFSFFESSLPAVPPPQPKADPNDPFSVFEGRQRSVSVASSAKTFTRSPPRKVPTPPIQPLTGATSSAQRRKNEEEATIRDILNGLPDLSYMLR